MGQRYDAQCYLGRKPDERNPARARVNPDHQPPNAREITQRRRREWDAMHGINPEEMHNS